MSGSIFSQDGLSRIFGGELEENKKRGGDVNHHRLRGFRFEDVEIMRARGIVINEESRTSPDMRGVYRMGFTMQGVARCAPSDSGFFPRAWTRKQIMSAIGEAYEARALKNLQERIYQGRTREGMRIRLWLDDADKVIDAMPLRAKLNKRREAKWNIKRGQYQHSRHVCDECKSLKVYVCPRGHRLLAPIGVALFIERMVKKILGRGWLHAATVGRERS